MVKLAIRPGELAVMVQCGLLHDKAASWSQLVLVITTHDDRVMCLNRAGVCVASKSQVRLWRLKRSK